MWNQWSAGPPPLPSNSLVNSATLIGPVQPTAPASNIPPVQALPGVQPIQTTMYPSSSGAPSYTPAQFAALTPDQQYAVQQHWQQWQAYEQQYAQWHAQYGEQYKREMAAMHGTPTTAVPSYSALAPPVSSFNFPPPAVVSALPKQQAQNFAPPPPPPEETSNLSGVKAPPQIYEQPPPPPPPPQTDEKRNGKSESMTQFQSIPPSIGSYPSAQFMQNQDIRWSQPPPNMMMQENRWKEPPALVDHQPIQHSTESHQQFNNNNQSNVGRDNRQKHDRIRFQSKSSQLIENSRQQQFEDASGVKTQLDRSVRNNRGIYDSDRFGNYDNHTNSASSSWNQNNNSTEKQNVTALNSQTTTKTGNGSVDEKTFDEQFRLWEEQFENWKKENANHPDRTMYMQYEREFEKTRVRLLERREQMRRRKMLENQQKHQEIDPKEKLENINKTDVQDIPTNDDVVAITTKGQRGEGSEVEKTESDAGDQDSSKKACVGENPESGASADNVGLENNVFKNKEITELFKSASGIPGLDLVEGKDEGRTSDPYGKVTDPEIIDLEMDNDGFPKKIPTTKSQILDSVTREQNVMCSTANKRKNIPSLLDIVVEKPHLSPEIECEYRSSTRERSPTAIKSTKSADSLSRSISGDGDKLSPGQGSTLSVSQGQTFLNNNTERSNEQSDHKIPDSRVVQEKGDPPQNVSEIAKALQDPNVMQLLSVALAQAQQTGGIMQSTSSQQIQLLHQLQQLQPLIQMQQGRNRLPQIWNNQQPQHPPSWQNQNNTFNIKSTNNSDQNRSSLSSNPFSRNIEQMQSNRGLGSGNDSDSINDVQQRNPQNPFRRSVGGFGSDNNSVGNPSFGSNLNQGPFEGTFAQQPRGNSFNGAGRFDNTRPYSNIGMSLGFRNNQNNFGDRGGDDEGFRPAQVFEYQNRSRTDAIVPPTKVVDYGHRPSPVISTSSFNLDSSEFVPVKTIDYGHASSSAQVENKFSKNILYNEKKRNLEHRYKAQLPSQGHTSVIEKEKNNDFTSKQTTSELQTNNETLQGLNGDDKFKVIKNTNEENNQRNKMNTKESKDTIEINDEYPKCKWILQNPGSRIRPGPPTKRGKRNASHFVNKQEKVSSENNDAEYDEIEENFEEISDNEELIETDDIVSKDDEIKVKIRPLFPSVSDVIPNTAMVFPSMENNNTIPIDEILFKPGRLTRPKNIVIIIRGPPGSGKSYVAKLIKDKEIEMGGPTPRLLSIDDYFMIENDYMEKCPKSGRKIPKKEILYEYEKEMEDTYMQYLIKSFKKTISDHLFDFIIVDCCNQSLRTFNEFYNAARDGNFSPFIIDMKCDIDKCLNQNIHNRNEDDIKTIIKNYQDCPGHYIKLDVSNLLENVVEMEDVSDLEDNFVADSEVNDPDEDEGDDINAGGFLKSKWDTDPTTENLARLDGTSKPISKRGTSTLEEYLQIDGWEPPPSSTNGKKRVRWADIEEKRAQEKMRAIGFVVGQTDWSRMMDPTSGSGALTKTKYIERLNRRR